MALPVAAIVGRPNVGKSTLFNKIVGQRLAIVADTPGVTRDRVYAKAEWRGRDFMVVDTGGIEPRTNDAMLERMRAQACLAMESADVIILVTDLKAGVTANDLDVAEMLRKSAKPVVLCVNKCDALGENPPEFYEFYNLGLSDPVAVSSLHGTGTGDLLDEVLRNFPPQAEEDEEDERIRVAIIGKPNVGKSTLLNRFAGQERSIVADEAGTTRDAVDLPVDRPEGKFLFIDTAGIRRKAKVTEDIEHYSVLRAFLAVDRADVCVTVLDAQTGFTEQDSKVAGYAHNQGKAGIIAVNKWDLIEKDDKTMREFQKKLEDGFSFMSYAPMLFLSAKTGQRVSKLIPMIVSAAQNNAMRIPTGRLNDMLAYATARVEPPSDKGRRLKIYYITQVSVKPPTFVLFVNKKELCHFSYQRFLENRIRETFGLAGTPIRLIVREREEKG